MKFNFITEIKNDIWNWNECAAGKASWGMDWTVSWPKDFPIEDGKDKMKIRNYLNKKYYKNNLVQKYAEWMSVAVSPDIVNNVLVKITGHEVPFQVVYVQITTYERYPYDSNGGGFYLGYGSSIGGFYKTALHECMHFIVHKHYWKKMLDSGLSDDQAQDIKEALTILLDPDMKRLTRMIDGGYPNHQNLRKEIQKIADKTKNFDEIMAETIKIYLNKYKEKVS